jgi:tRNA (cmo5U34)-methyltransferase
MNKATTKEIQERFDNDVERFSNLKILLELVTESANRIKPQAINLLDIGCGAGNYTLKMLSKLPNLNCTLLDLSQQMLKKAHERILYETNGKVEIIQGDIRDVDLQNDHYDIILAGAVLHHLRNDSDWELVFTKLFRALSTGGCFLISDLIKQDTEALNDYFREEYGKYLENIGGKDYKAEMFNSIEKEDTPRSLEYQLGLMKTVGFSKVEILHKNLCFAAFGGIK